MKIHIIAISFVLFHGDLFKFCLRWLNKDASRKFVSIICSNQSRQALNSHEKLIKVLMYKKIKLDQINISLNFYKGKRKTFFQKRKFSQIKKYKTFSQEKNCTFVRNFCYNY